MRTVRLSIAGVLILGLLGGIASLSAAQSDAPGAAESALLSGTMSYPAVSDPTAPTLEEGRTLYRGYGFRGAIDTGDPRLSGELWSIHSYDTFHDSGGSVGIGIAGMDLQNGAWRGTFDGYGTRYNDRIYHHLHLTGEGAYEGLSATLFLLDNGTGLDIEGMIYPGELPPLPETPDADVAASAQEAASAQQEADGGPSTYLFATGEGMMVPDFENPADCDIGFTSVTTVTGRSSLLGDYTAEWSNCYVPADTLQNVHDGSWTFTAENGDILTGVGTGDCIPDWTDVVGGLFTCYGAISVSGGTGAFEGASGEVHMIGEIVNSGTDEDGVPLPHSATGMFEGLIDY